MKLPFKGEWSVTWGGDTKEQNYHVESVAQKNALPEKAQLIPIHTAPQ